MESKSITLEGNLCNNINGLFVPHIRISGKERININSILYEFFYGSELLELNDSIWRETMDAFRITIERLY